MSKRYAGYLVIYHIHSENGRRSYGTNYWSRRAWAEEDAQNMRRLEQYHDVRVRPLRFADEDTDPDQDRGYKGVKTVWDTLD